MFSFLKKLHRDQSGASAVEFALIAPFFIISTLFMADLGMVAYDKMKLTSGIRSAMQYVLVGGTDDDAINDIVERTSGITSTTTMSQYCSCSSARETSVECGSTCESGGLNTYTRLSTEHVRTLLMKDWTITAEMDFRTE